jgi:hypothetical protein
MPTDAGGLDRRRFLGVAGVGALSVFAGSVSKAQAASTGQAVAVWQLDPDWGYPRGAHAKTRLVSRASRRAAQNRFALSEQEALDMNLHLCSFAPAVMRTVCADTFVDLWQRRSYEWTNPWSGRVARVLDRRHLSLSDAAQLEGACVAGAGELVSFDTLASTATARHDPGTLPFTGGAQRELAAVGVAALVSGVIAMRQGKRWTDHAAAESER